MESSVIFLVIDDKTMYNLLLERPWLHQYRIIASMWHQCFKYNHDGEEIKVLVDERPFFEAKSYFAEAKFYLSSMNADKVMISPSLTKTMKEGDGLKSNIEKPSPRASKGKEIDILHEKRTK